MVLTSFEAQLIKPDWPAPSSVVAFTTTREAGFSQGRYAGLNVGMHVNDDPEAVAANRALLPEAQRIAWLEQVHKNRCVRLPAESRQADASTSCNRLWWCAVMTADCVPVLLCDRQGSEVAAIHAGWQGLEQQVIARTVTELRAQPADVMAWVGPAICQQHYQVDANLAARFEYVDGAVVPDTIAGKFLLDLPAVAQHQLKKAGINAIYHSRLCTYADPNRFYSHRFAQHQQALPTGRMVSVIGLR
ncbi:peptidoglycan editing factor PgeF [Salinimonas marina]|uniref:Purine nucleoside phosphorylase n=1 Tax=Salinimonas marina TaxID=2785918 RepID=A0A7S9DZ45_9ALTE|nr:peptidoglycan editing factor PgeF [Salinimonas marina]QPG06609.1 peptidoglycan editing factor PgeF [Salinimonas marina]